MKNQIRRHSLEEWYDKPGSKMFYRQVQYGHQLPSDDDPGVSPSMDAFLNDKKLAEAKSNSKDEKSRSSNSKSGRSSDRMSISQRTKMHLAQRRSTNRLRRCICNVHLSFHSL